MDARGLYRRGRFGQFRCGEAKLVEPYYYRHSNFQNWFTKENSDPFTYIGCHYVDLVYFITGLRPVEVSVRGVEGPFPNGKIGYLWSPAQVVWENGAILSVVNGLGYPDEAAGTQRSGPVHVLRRGRPGRHHPPRRPVPRRQPRLRRPARRGRPSASSAPTISASCPGRATDSSRSATATIRSRPSSRRRSTCSAAGAGLAESDALAKRQEALEEIDRRGILATPANSFINELVVEAARMSITHDGRQVAIVYDPAPAVRM